MCISIMYVFIVEINYKRARFNGNKVCWEYKVSHDDKGGKKTSEFLILHAITPRVVMFYRILMGFYNESGAAAY